MWLEQLQLRGGATDPFLVRSAARGAFVVEGRMRRQVKAGMLFNALAQVFPRREMSDADLDAREEGPPVEVLEGPSGPAFVVVGGRRLPLRGLPLPYPVSAEEMMFFPEAQELRVGAAGGPVAPGALARIRRLAGRARRKLRSKRRSSRR